MELRDYKKVRKYHPYLKPEEIGALRNDIHELLKETGRPAEGFPPRTERDRLEGFACFLLDYQGVYDEVFAEIAEEMEAFTEVVMTFGLPFADAEYRLLQITGRYDLATLHPEKENVAKFILANIEKYSPQELKQVSRKLKEVSVSAFFKSEAMQTLLTVSLVKSNWLCRLMF